MSKMKLRYARLALLPLALVVGLGAAGCRVRQTEEGKMPEVQVKDGKVPKYDVDTAKVDVTKQKVQVEVPKVKVTMPPDHPQSTEPK
ncbi:MAG TPA: hypothetical protein VGR07_21070 [Thermoanaerobaculia bacterium]|jgi:hypothetical protein|nr:hypothetical protein [Thermoanaerobaculia bacterium]